MAFFLTHNTSLLEERRISLIHALVSSHIFIDAYFWENTYRRYMDNNQLGIEVGKAKYYIIDSSVGRTMSYNCIKHTVRTLTE